MNHDEAKQIYPPRSLRDFQEIELMVNEGHDNAKILDHMKNPRWGSHVERFQGHEWCSRCQQKINLNYCIECHQEILPAGDHLDSIDFDAVTGAERKASLRVIAGELIQNGISKQLARYLIDAVNFKHCQPALSNKEIEEMVESTRWK